MLSIATFSRRHFKAIHKLISLVVVTCLITQLGVGAFKPVKATNSEPTWAGRLPDWASDPQYGRPRAADYQNAAPQLRNASPLEQYQYLTTQLPEDLWDILADTIFDAPPTILENYPLPPATPQQDANLVAQTHNIFLPILPAPGQPVWGTKPVFDLLLPNPATLATELNFNTTQIAIVTSAITAENQARAVLDAQANLIINDPDLTLAQKQAAIAAMNYNGQLLDILADTDTTLRNQLNPNAYHTLISWLENNFQVKRQQIENLRQQQGSNAATNCFEGVVYATTSTHLDNSVDLPDQYLKFANLGWPTIPGYESPPYAVGLDYNGVITSGIIITDVAPWNADDNYWRLPTDPIQPRRLFTDLPLGKPEAEAAYFDGYNGGLDQHGRIVTNPAGINLSQPVAAYLGFPGGIDLVTVTYDWDCDAPSRVNRTFGLNNFTTYAAQGVNPSTGNQFYWYRDFLVPGRGLNVDMVRYYNAQLDEAGLFGLGWSTIYDMYLKFYANGVIEVRYADGHKGYFVPDGSGGYSAEPGIFETLAPTTNGYRLSTIDQIFFDFATDGRLLTISDSANNQQTLNYSGAILDSITDTTGRVFSFIHNAAGHVTQIDAPGMRAHTFTYGTNFNGDHIVSSSGDILLSATNAGNGTTSYGYDPNGDWLNRVTDPTGVDYLQNIYTPDGRVQSQQDGNSNSGDFTYDLVNLTATQTDALGNQTIYYFDSDFRVIKEEDELGHTIEYTYDGDNIASMTDKRGNTWHYTYDSRGNMLTKEDPVDAYSVFYYTTDITRYEYDVNNNMTLMEDSLGNITRYEYDANNNPIKVIEPNLAETTATYNANNEMISLTDAEGRITRYEYDSHGNLIKTIDPYLNETTSTYDANGNELSRTDAEGRITRFEYDNNDNMLKMIDPLGEEIRFEYDGNNWLKKKIDRRDGIWEWEYDDNGNPTLERDPMGNTITHTYDAMNNRLTTTDARNNLILTYTYDELYRLIKVVDAALQETHYSYDPNGNLLTITDPLGEQTNFVYDAVNRRKYVYDALGGVTEYCYDSLDRIIRMFDPRRAMTDFVYDNVGNLIEVHDPLANVTSLGYDRVHNRTSITDPRNFTTHYEFDDLNRQIQVTDPLSQTMQTGYDKVGNTTVITDAMGFVSTYEYNNNNWVITTTNALLDQTFSTYDPEGSRTDFKDERGHTTHTVYNLAGYVTDMIDPMGGVTHYEYDPNYNVILVENALTHETHYSYDPRNLLETETDPLLHTTTYQYDALRRLTQVTDAEGNSTHYGYDELGRLISVTDALNQVTEYEYDEVGNLLTIIDANDIETAFEYNFLNQLKKEINPLGDTWRYGYDPSGNMVLRVDGEWQATAYRYDGINQLTTVIYGSTGQRVTYMYDANGNELSMTDGNGTFTYLYDALNRRISATDHNSEELEYSYDPAGNRIGMEYPDGRTITMDYDDNNRLTTLTDPQNRDITWQYNALGYITSQANPNGTATAYQYDAANRLTHLENDGSTDIIAHYTYTMDDVGNRTTIVEDRADWQNPITRNYTYDELYRLTRVQTSNGGDAHYAFDPVGNRMEKSGIPEPAVGITTTLPVTTTYGFNDLNSMLYAGDKTFGYDANGSRLSQTVPLTATEYISVAMSLGIYTGTLQTDYAYNYENRLTYVSTYISATGNVSLTLPVMQAEYTYDGYGRRINKIVTTTITSTQVLTTPQILTRDYIFDGLDPVVEYEQTQGVTTQDVTAFYYRANGRIVLQEREENSNPVESYWYHSDSLTTVIALSNETGIVTYETQYDEYGNLLDENTTSVNHYTYTGQEIDSETGLYHFYAREYDPEVSIWLTQDKYRGDMGKPITLHRYNYVNDNPTNAIDLLGYFGLGAIVALVAIVVVVVVVAVVISGAHSGNKDKDKDKEKDKERNAREEDSKPDSTDGTDYYDSIDYDALAQVTANNAPENPASDKVKARMRRMVEEAKKYNLPQDQLAYIFATAHHESVFGYRMEEYADGSAYEGWKVLGNTEEGDGKRFKGRGYVQLTGRTNYQKYTDLYGVDLINNPELASDHEWATKILFHGMANGTYTTKKLSDYLKDDGSLDFVEARRVVNGQDKAQEIADLAQKYLEALPSD